MVYVLYTDDSILAGPSQREIDKVIQEIKDVGVSALERASTSLGDDGSGESWADRLGDPKTRTPDDQLSRAEQERRVRRALSRLDDRARRVVEMRFGLDGDGARTYQAIGDALGVTRERARQIVTAALSVLREALDVRFAA